MKIELFKDNVESPVSDMDIGIFSPGKDDVMDVDEIVMTPVSKGRLPKPMICDEDSGLGFDTFTSEAVSLEDSEIISESLFQINRPEHSFGILVSRLKSKRSLFDDSEVSKNPTKSRCHHAPLRRFHSLTEPVTDVDGNQNCEIQSIVDRFVEGSNLIADGSTTYCLPVVKGKHSDLNSITPHTLSEVLDGAFNDVILSYKIIDCRYPYEYDGGHIKGAENIYEKEKILDLLQNQTSVSNSHKRQILIFYCEFSSERGPKMLRFLRNKDREANADNYPSLCYPEVYLLHGGYKNFYEHQQDHCVPIGYTPMLHRDHGADLRHFRIRSKTWAFGEKRKQAAKFICF